jgi:hypothetical protein
MKIVVFDLDETLGYFTQFGIFWDSLEKYLKIKDKKLLTQHDFNDILDLFPEFLRPNIINILKYLKDKKDSMCCHKMMIYTNNNGPREWAEHIIKYFEEKINYKLVDQIVAAFKVNGKHIEICRTTHNKTHTDFIRCTKIPSNAEICFLDDTFYPEMANDNIYYINIKPYYHDLQFTEMIKRLSGSTIGKKIIGDSDDFEKIMLSTIKNYKYNCIDKDDKEYEVDKILGKHIINHLHNFFNKSKKIKTLKNYHEKRIKNQRNKTQRNKTH